MNLLAHGSAIRDPRPMIVHVVYRFDVGGLENGVVNLINRLPVESYRHAVVSLTEITDFRRRVVRDDVTFIALNKGPGHLYRFFPRLYRLFRELAPAIVHTRNLAALEASVPAWMAGVPVRVHGEHGRDMGDLDGTNRKYQRVRRLYRPFVNQYVALSKDLEKYLSTRLAVDPQSIDQIYNGVDTDRFAPAPGRRIGIEGCPFSRDECWLVGTVGRLHEVKDQVTLAEAFVRAVRRSSAMAKMRLVIVGDGPLMARVEKVLVAADMRDLAWLPGERNDVPQILRGLDCFVLPSLAEGISNTILEAMACGIPVVATRVGGNPELVEDGMTGMLVPQANAEAMATALLNYFEDPVMARRHGNAGRHAVLQRFSLDRMVADYHSLYATLIAGRASRPERAGGNAPGRQAML
jgi:sugar transferase (PEP-CTERM/EpsH1 system associated)